MVGEIDGDHNSQGGEDHLKHGQARIGKPQIQTGPENNKQQRIDEKAKAEKKYHPFRRQPDKTHAVALKNQ
jgi:hypothetical protein